MAFPPVMTKIGSVPTLSPGAGVDDPEGVLAGVEDSNEMLLGRQVQDRKTASAIDLCDEVSEPYALARRLPANAAGDVP